MADGTKIEWTDATWNVVNGCSVHSPGCTNCYAMRLAGTRLRDHASRAGLTRDSKAGPVWTGEVRFNDKVLLDPLKWRRPRRIFVCAHGDLFHESVPDEWIDRVFAVMALAPQHQFQVLTKRADRMRAWFERYDTAHDHNCADFVADQMAVLLGVPGAKGAARTGDHDWDWPLKNVWLGVSVEDQARADERIPDLLATPAAIRWLSCEPMLGPVDLRAFVPRERYYMMVCEHCGWRGSTELAHVYSYGDDADVGCPKCDAVTLANEVQGLHWIVAGGESGPAARPMHPDWIISLRDQCEASSIPFLFKQWGEYLPVYVDKLTCAGFEYRKVGKKAAGRRLHGIEHNGFPA